MTKKKSLDVHDWKSCLTCANCIKIIEGKIKNLKYGDIKEIECRVYRQPTYFRKFCSYYNERTCENCLFMKEFKYQGRIKEKIQAKYDNFKYFDVWRLDCEKEGEFSHLKNKCEKEGGLAYPSCSLWRWRGEDES